MIRANIKDLSDAFDPTERTFLFYFGGHGFTQGEINYLVPFGTTLDDRAAEGLPVTEVHKLINKGLRCQANL